MIKMFRALGLLWVLVLNGATAACSAEPASSPVALTAEQSAACVGYYQYADYRFYQFADFPVVARVYQEGSRWFVQDTGQEPVELIPSRVDERAARFTTTINKKEYVFVMGPDGKARELATIRQGHVEDQAPRVSQGEWKASLAKLQQRLASKLPSRGTEAALRAQVDGWLGRSGTYLPVPYKVSGTQMEPQTPQGFRQLLDQLGAFAGLRFVKVTQTGWDLFHLQFAQGTLEIAVAPLSPGGKFAGENYRLLGPALPAAQPPEIRLWPGKAPGTEQWTLPETVTQSPNGARIVTNVSDPTLTVYLPDASRATGAAVVIAPGGALRMLAMGSDGEPVARWLNSKGIAAFVLKYRTLQMTPARQAEMAAPPGMAAGGRRELDIRNGNANPAPDDAQLTQVLQMGIADAQAALRLVRSQAQQWHVDPSRVGMMGFSAGGGVMLGAALTPDKTDASPDFIISLYGPSLLDVNPPPHAPPLFIAVGSAHFNVTNGSIALFQQWKAAGKSAELHVYDGVTGGFNMSTQGRPVDGWPDRVFEWLVAKRFTTP